MNDAPQPAGRRLLYWLSEVAQEAREEAGVSREAVAANYGSTGVTVTRFEQHAGHWPKDPDALMKAYADAIGIDDARELYSRALARWYAEVPDLSTPDAERPEPPSSTPLPTRTAGRGRGSRGA